MISSDPLFTGLSVVLLCLAWASLLLPLARLPLALRPVLIVGITLLLMLPLAGDPAWYAVRGTFGDSSISALLFYIAFILQQNFSWQLCRPVELVLLRRLLAVTALLLYPFALGLTGFDSYSLGYANPWLLAILFIMALLFWWRTYYFLAISLAASVAAWSLQMLESGNLWDYLLDPVFVVLLLLTCMKPAVASHQTR
ncbi:MAG: hypothetical protein OEV12_06990 [Gammaproteobacteria bacterium]|nr:hypothetical protein [Gammaproteobacteria bacterium]MDH3971212.1 hypothetical protein [Gammaproteobacteria bacterium]MDH3986142.1 hypothetical protein [Gammaproteobacteria bacterium]